jgi:hypothetical protein
LGWGPSHPPGYGPGGNNNIVIHRIRSSVQNRNKYNLSAGETDPKNRLKKTKGFVKK